MINGFLLMKKLSIALASVAHFIGASSHNQKVVDLIPGPGMSMYDSWPGGHDPQSQHQFLVQSSKDATN